MLSPFLFYLIAPRSCLGSLERCCFEAVTEEQVFRNPLGGGPAYCGFSLWPLINLRHGLPGYRTCSFRPRREICDRVSRGERAVTALPALWESGPYTAIFSALRNPANEMRKKKSPPYCVATFFLGDVFSGDFFPIAFALGGRRLRASMILFHEPPSPAYFGSDTIAQNATENLRTSSSPIILGDPRLFFILEGAAIGRSDAGRESFNTACRCMPWPSLSHRIPGRLECETEYAGLRPFFFFAAHGARNPSLRPPPFSAIVSAGYSPKCAKTRLLFTTRPASLGIIAAGKGRPRYFPPCPPSCNQCACF